MDQYSEALSERGASPSTRELLHRVYRLYRQSFGRWFAVTAPASLIAAVALLMTAQKVHEIFRSLPRGRGVLQHPLELAEAGVTRFGGFFIAWLLGCFALGAIATIVNELWDDDPGTPWISDSYQRVRERLVPLVLVAAFTFAMFLAGNVVSLLLEEVLLIRAVGPAYLHAVIYWGAFAGVVIVASVVSWFGMAIPLLLRDDTLSSRQALKTSLKVSDGYEGYLFLLVFESVAGSYVAALAARYGLALLIPPAQTYSGWFPWAVFFATALASAAVQPPMFIGFSLLAGQVSGSSPAVP